MQSGEYRELLRRILALEQGARVVSGGTAGVSHASAHEDGGSDEIDVTGLSGLLADPQRVDYAQHVIVAKSGGDFTSIQGAIDSISDAASSKRYLIQVMPGNYAEQVTMKSWVDIRGAGKHATQIEFGSTGGAVILADFVQLEDVLIELTSTEGHWGIVGDNVSNWHIRNVDLLRSNNTKRGAGIKVTGASWNTGFIEHCVINTSTEENHGIYLDSDGVDLADVTINDVFVDSFEATTGGSILLDNILDTQLRDVYARTSAAGYGLRITGTSAVSATNGWFEFGDASIEVETGATLQMHALVADSISGAGTWEGTRYDRDSDNFQVIEASLPKVTLFNEGYLRLYKHASSPATPPTDFGSIYLANTHERLSYKDDGGVERTLLPVVRRKTGDESVTSDTLQDDDHLVFPIGANEIWAVEYVLFCTAATTTPDIKFEITVPSGATLRFGNHSLDVAVASQTGNMNSVTRAGGSPIVAGLPGASTMHLLKATVVNGANAGNVQLQWAQNTSTGGTASQILTNSYLIAHRFG